MRNKKQDIFYSLIAVKKPPVLAKAAGVNSLILIDLYKNPLRFSVELESKLERGLMKLDERKNLAMLYDPRRGMPAYCISLIFIECAKKRKTAHHAARRIFNQSDKISADNTLLWSHFALSVECFQKDMIESLMNCRSDVLQNRNIRILFEAAKKRVCNKISRKDHEDLFYALIGGRNFVGQNI